MIGIELLVVLAAIYLGARIGSIGIGFAGGLGPSNLRTDSAGGQLSVDPQGNIVRMLDWATYQNGKLVSDSAVPQLEDATHEEATDTTSPAVVEPVAVGSDEQGTAL